MHHTGAASIGADGADTEFAASLDDGVQNRVGIFATPKTRIMDDLKSVSLRHVADSEQRRRRSISAPIQARNKITVTVTRDVGQAHRHRTLVAARLNLLPSQHMIAEHGWSRNMLTIKIQSAAHARQGKAISNFANLLPPAQSDLIVQALKDPYVFDFLTLEEPFHERELETSLLQHIQRFLLELGQGFAFVGRQHPITVGDEDFYIDLLFYHLRLRCFVVIDLKKGAFKAEHAGKMNFYLNVVDDKLRHETDAPTIGLILCQDRNRVIAEYALRGMNKPIGISEYELTRTLPNELQSNLPTIEAIEAELAGTPPEKPAPKRLTAKKKRASKKHSRPS